VTSLTPSSRATVATALPVVKTSFTASPLYSGVKSRRDLAKVNILSCEVSTRRGQGQSDFLDHEDALSLVNAMLLPALSAEIEDGAWDPSQQQWVRRS